MNQAALSHSGAQRPLRQAERVSPDLLASVDLGSNSFHMVVARHAQGRLTVIERLRETVRLGSGMSRSRRLQKASIERALACLERFGRRLRELRPDSVRVVGTNALRLARRKRAFLQRACEALGHPIEIISGREEARLIYLGVVHSMQSESGRQLVVDIGGGSTELVIGEGPTLLEVESLQLGCVSYSERFFRDGRITAARLERARAAARLELESIVDLFRRRGWNRVLGSSGMVRAIARSIFDLGPRAEAITYPGLERLARCALDAGHVRKVAIASLTDDQRPIFPGGLAITLEIFSVLGVEEMRVAEGAMREGALFDMLSRQGLPRDGLAAFS